MLLKRLLLFVFIYSVTPYPASSCSSFVLKNGKTILLGKNFDWTFDQGYIIKNIRNTPKLAYLTHEGHPAAWVSKYGSITFNQNGKEMPYGGMNEKGLVAEMLWLEDTKYNISEDKKYVSELEWIQYQLDNFQTIDEVVANIENLKIYPIKGSIHYILADPTGKSIIVEYLDGKAKIYEKDIHSCQAITNKTVTFSQKYIDNLNDIPRRNSSEIYRYHQLEAQIKNLQNPQDFSEKKAFQMLQDVSILKGDFKTVWSIVYNLESKSISFLSHGNKKIKKIHLDNMDFDQRLSYFDINQNKELILDKSLKPLDEKKNFEVMSASLIHLGFDLNLSKEISNHQLNQQVSTASYFANNYFHFDISIPLTETGKYMIFAVMDSKENFTNRKTVTGGYATGTTHIGLFNRHLYGLKNGAYTVILLLDENRNSQLDFDSQGNPIEKYATSSDFIPKSMEELTFESTSNLFDKENSKIVFEWR